VGHVTKEGQIAGPRVVEHMVDTVLYFEGERGHQFRILRAVKNRFGASDEIGVFEMTGAGLRQVTNPSELFLSNREAPASGSAVFAGMEGTRPVLVELQALVADSPLGTPRRNVVGWDSNRLSMILAVLDSRCGISFAGQDVYLNVAPPILLSPPRSCPPASTARLPKTQLFLAKSVFQAASDRWHSPNHACAKQISSDLPQSTHQNCQNRWNNPKWMLKAMII